MASRVVGEFFYSLLKKSTTSILNNPFTPTVGEFGCVEQGTYLFWFDCSTLGIPDEQLSHHFAQVGKIGLNAGSAYGPSGKQYMRLNFAAPHSTVIEGLKRIKYAFDHPNA